MLTLEQMKSREDRAWRRLRSFQKRVEPKMERLRVSWLLAEDRRIKEQRRIKRRAVGW